MSDLDEPSKAVAELAKFGKTVVEKVSNVPGFVARYIDEPFSELIGAWVGIHADNKKFDRWENKVKIFDRVNAILKERGCKTRKLIPPKLGIPLIDNALLEDDDDLRELWCNLIANSLDPNFDEEIRNSYVEIIRSITSLDAKILEYIFKETFNITIATIEVTNSTVRIVDCRIRFDKIIEYIKCEPNKIRLSLDNLMRVQCIQDITVRDTVKAMKSGVDVITIEESYSLTELGFHFIKACMKDKQIVLQRRDQTTVTLKI